MLRCFDTNCKTIRLSAEIYACGDMMPVKAAAQETDSIMVISNSTQEK